MMSTVWQAVATVLLLTVSMSSAQSVEGSLQFLPLGTTRGVTPSTLDGKFGARQYSLVSERIPIPGGFPFDTQFPNGVYVNNQGYLSLEDDGTLPFKMGSIPNYTVAPFWQNDESAISVTTFEVHSRTSVASELLDRVSVFITRELCLKADFSGTWMLAVEWNQTFNLNPLMVLNFQGILITDGSESYTVFTYHCERMNRRSTYNIGFNAISNFQSVLSGTVVTSAPFNAGCDDSSSTYSRSIIYKLDSGLVCSQGDIRMEDCGTNEGRVQLCRGSRTPNPGYWMTVCDTEWTATDAGVACRQLGFSPEGAVNKTTVNSGTSTIFECNGSELLLTECMKQANTECSFASVACQTEETEDSGSSSSNVVVIIGAIVVVVVVALIMIITVVLVVAWVRSRKPYTKDIEDTRHVEVKKKERQQTDGLTNSNVGFQEWSVDVSGHAQPTGTSCPNDDNYEVVDSVQNAGFAPWGEDMPSQPNPAYGLVPPKLTSYTADQGIAEQYEGYMYDNDEDMSPQWNPAYGVPVHVYKDATPVEVHFPRASGH